MSYQRQDLGTPPVVTPQYERIVGGATTSVTLRGLEPGTTYRIRVWSTDGTSVSSGAGEVDVMTMESGEFILLSFIYFCTIILYTYVSVTEVNVLKYLDGMKLIVWQCNQNVLITYPLSLFSHIVRAIMLHC